MRLLLESQNYLCHILCVRAYARVYTHPTYYVCMIYRRKKSILHMRTNLILMTCVDKSCPLILFSDAGLICKKSQWRGIRKQNWKKKSRNKIEKKVAMSLIARSLRPPTEFSTCVHLGKVARHRVPVSLILASLRNLPDNFRSAAISAKSRGIAHPENCRSK